MGTAISLNLVGGIGGLFQSLESFGLDRFPHVLRPPNSKDFPWCVHTAGFNISCSTRRTDMDNVEIVAKWTHQTGIPQLRQVLGPRAAILSLNPERPKEVKWCLSHAKRHWVDLCHESSYDSVLVLQCKLPLRSWMVNWGSFGDIDKP